MSDNDFQAEITARYDAPMYRAMLEVWGDQIHPGLLESEDEALYPAAVRATMRLAELANIQRGCRVLETACGVGGTARLLARDFDCHVTATNISKGQLETAAEWTDGEPGADRITYEFANFEELAYDDASFDVYWCQDALLFSTQRATAMAEAGRVVKPGGTVAITDLTIVGEPEGETAELLAEISKPGFWSLEDYVAALDEAGFDLIAAEDWSRHVLPSFQRIRDDMILKKDQLVAIAGLEEVEDSIERYNHWCDAAATGYLGWAAVTGRKRET